MQKGTADSIQKSKTGQEFIPYVPADKVLPEFTPVSIVVGIILAVVFGGANAYLGLKVGMTVSASIPAAVVSMAIIRGLLRRDSILENNIVQTIGSAGESLAAGAIFTIPAIFLWGVKPDMMTVTSLALIGGLLGVLMMVPLRRFLIVNEHGVLPYPEGTACAEVLKAGEVGGSSAKMVFTGLGIGALYKFIADGLKAFPGEIEWEIPGFKGAAVGADIYPALMGVGFIIGPRIAAFMLAGAVLAWFGFIPLITYFGNFISQPIYPASVSISELGYWGIWTNYIRYVGAGAVAMGGIISLIKSIPLIVKAFKGALGGFSMAMEGGMKRTDQDLPMKWVLLGVVFIIIASVIVLPVGILGAIAITVFGFFFVTVSSRIVGIVGSSSNPVSGMTIATLLFTTLILKASGFSGLEGMLAAISVGGVICIAAAIAGDTSQDLKTGFLVGATPRKQQIGELIGVVVSGLTIGWVLILLNSAYTFGSKELAAPQATLMKMVIEGIMQGNLPWTFVFTGAAAALVVELFGIASLPFAVGLYLPIHLSTPIMIGGIVRGLLDRKEKVEEVLKKKVEKGILYASGLIAGEGLMGIIIAVMVTAGIDVTLDKPLLGQTGALIAFLAMVASLVYVTFKKEEGLEQ